MNSPGQAIAVPEKDLIDRIAESLPADVRADYYREMRHCRSLPENDEMLRILRVMQFLVVLMVDVPERITTERQGFEQNIGVAIKALEKIRIKGDHRCYHLI